MHPRMRDLLPSFAAGSAQEVLDLPDGSPDGTWHLCVTLV